MQEPDCGRTTSPPTIVNRISKHDQTDLDHVIWFDYSNFSVHIETDNYEFANEDVIYTFQVSEPNVVHSEPLLVFINFTTMPLEFNMTDFEPETLHCNFKGASWKLDLPPIKEQEI